MGNPMPTITVKNTLTRVYEKLRRAAARNHRTLSNEIIACIERAVDSHDVDPDLLLANARKLRMKTVGHPTTRRELARAKAAGRP